MMEQQEIYEIFYNYISNIIDCSIGDANIVSLSKDIYSIAKEKLMGKIEKKLRVD